MTATVITHYTYTHCTHTTEHPFHAHVNHVQISNVSNQYKEVPNWFVAGDWYDTGNNNGQLQLHEHQLLATVSYLQHMFSSVSTPSIRLVVFVYSCCCVALSLPATPVLLNYQFHNLEQQRTLRALLHVSNQTVTLALW
jgi:hypothetical protein